MSCCMCEPMETAQPLDDDTHAVVTRAKWARENGTHTKCGPLRHRGASMTHRHVLEQGRGPHLTSPFPFLCFTELGDSMVHWSQLLFRPALRAQVSWGPQGQFTSRPFLPGQATLASPRVFTGKLESPLCAANARTARSSALGATFAKHWTATSLTIASPTTKNLVTALTANPSLATK